MPVTGSSSLPHVAPATGTTGPAPSSTANQSPTIPNSLTRVGEGEPAPGRTPSTPPAPNVAQPSQLQPSSGVAGTVLPLEEEFSLGALKHLFKSSKPGQAPNFAKAEALYKKSTHVFAKQQIANFAKVYAALPDHPGGKSSREIEKAVSDYIKLICADELGQQSAFGAMHVGGKKQFNKRQAVEGRLIKSANLSNPSARAGLDQPLLSAAAAYIEKNSETLLGEKKSVAVKDIPVLLHPASYDMLNQELAQIEKNIVKNVTLSDLALRLDLLASIPKLLAHGVEQPAAPAAAGAAEPAAAEPAAAEPAAAAPVAAPAAAPVAAPSAAPPSAAPSGNNPPVVAAAQAPEGIKIGTLNMSDDHSSHSNDTHIHNYYEKNGAGLRKTASATVSVSARPAVTGTGTQTLSERVADTTDGGNPAPTSNGAAPGAVVRPVAPGSANGSAKKAEPTPVSEPVIKKSVAKLPVARPQQPEIISKPVEQPLAPKLPSATPGPSVDETDAPAKRTNTRTEAVAPKDRPKDKIGAAIYDATTPLRPLTQVSKKKLVVPSGPQEKPESPSTAAPSAKTSRAAYEERYIADSASRLELLKKFFQNSENDADAKKAAFKSENGRITANQRKDNPYTLADLDNALAKKAAKLGSSSGPVRPDHRRVAVELTRNRNTESRFTGKAAPYEQTFTRDIKPHQKMLNGSTT